MPEVSSRLVKAGWVVLRFDYRGFELMMNVSVEWFDEWLSNDTGQKIKSKPENEKAITVKQAT
jgi:hypothetical protein